MIKYILILVTLFSNSCVGQDNSIYLFVDNNDELIVKEGRFYYVFSEKEKLEEYKKVKEYKPNDILKSDYTIPALKPGYCPELQFSDTNFKEMINKLELEKLNIVDRKSFFKKLKKNSKVFSVEKLDEDSFLITQHNGLPCL